MVNIMKNHIRLAIAQINCTVGDLGGNVRKITDYLGKAKTLRADIVSFPELAITGYPPEDLLLKESFIADLKSELELISSQLRTRMDEVLEKEGRLIEKDSALAGLADQLARNRVALEEKEAELMVLRGKS